VCADIVPEAVEKTASEIRSTGAAATGVACDVSDAAQVDALFAEAEALGGATGIVCNAAVQYEEPVESTPPEEWDRVLGVNLKGAYLCARAVIPQMRAKGGGSIVNMASVNGFWVEPSLAAYTSAKAGLIGLTRSIALDYGRDGIRCNCICPGYIDTGMAQRYFEIQDDPAAARESAGKLHALGRIGRAEEVAAMAAFLISDEASFCTAQSFVVDGGLSAGVPAS
jgi:NAD(P)-dependent dehydrogenase (short-subunit alcohol dehydrogenase family)